MLALLLFSVIWAVGSAIVPTDHPYVIPTEELPDPYSSDADTVMLEPEYTVPDVDYVPCSGVDGDLPPGKMNRIDAFIQRVKGTRFARVGVAIIRRQLKSKSSVLHQLLQKVGQDPAAPDFAEGAPGVTKRIPSRLVRFLVTFLGETKTVVGYLWSFGFLPKVLNRSAKGNYNGDIPPCALTNAIREFQRFNGLETTGILTKETRLLMAKDRCGNPDVECENCEESDRKKRYSVRGKTWEVSDNINSKHQLVLHYYFKNYASSSLLSEEDCRSDVQKGLETWTKDAPVFFVETKVESEADVSISFVAKEHGDDSPFDGSMGVIGHAYYPLSGEIHFDDDEKFKASHDKRHEGVSILYTATHEAGHTLGIKHTGVTNAIMYPYYDDELGKGTDFTLSADDKSAITAMYGPGQGGVYPIGQGAADEIGKSGSKPINIDDIQESCDTRFQATFTDPTSKKLLRYMLFGDKYMVLATKSDNYKHSASSKLPLFRERAQHKLVGKFPQIGKEAPFQAAVTLGRESYFFKTKQVCTYVWDADWMYCEPISDSRMFRDIPGEIVGAVAHNRQTLIVFSGDRYYLTRKTGVVHGAGHQLPFDGVYLAFNSFYNGYVYVSLADSPDDYLLLKTKVLYRKGNGCGTVGCAEAAIWTGWSYRSMFMDWQLEKQDFNFCETELLVSV